MLITRKIAIMFLLLLSVGSAVWSQAFPTPPVVYVAGGTTIYSVANGAATAIFTSPNPNSNFESIAIGPDNAFADTDGNGNAAHPFLLYACDTGTGINSIIRFDPTAAAITPQTVASGLAFPPICARSTATSDVYVTSKSGAGIFQLIASSTHTCTQNVLVAQTVPVGCIPFTGTAITATATSVDTFAGMMGRGIAQKYIGDLLVVDNAFNGGAGQVLHSAYGAGALPLFATLSQLITTNLNGPIGVVSAPSLRQIFVSNSNSNVTKATPAQPAVSIFDASGTPSSTSCPSGLTLPRNTQEVPSYLATAPTDQFSGTNPNKTNKLITDNIYLVTEAGNLKSGTLWSWNTAQVQLPNGTCQFTQVATFSTGVSGVAVAPAPVTLTLTEIGTVANPVATRFNFNSNIFELTATACDATVTAYPFSQATVKSMINLAGPINPETLSVNLGDGGFETGYVAHNPQCSSVFQDLTYLMRIYNFTDNGQFTNPRTLDCTNGPKNFNTEPQLIAGLTSCTVATTGEVYPLGGPILGDSGRGIITNFFAAVNENAGAGTGQPGQFCGFDPPLGGDGTILPSPPTPLTGNSTTVKFKVADLTHGGNCQSGGYLSDKTRPVPVALLSVAQVCNTTPSNDPFCGPGGSPVFNAINVNNNATSSQPALFSVVNSDFKFSMLIGGLDPGTYSLTATFLTDNTTNQTTLFTIPCPASGCPK